MNEFEIQCSSSRLKLAKIRKYQGDVRERMKGLRGTELDTPFHPLYTPWGLSPGGMDQSMAHWCNAVKPFHGENCPASFQNIWRTIPPNDTSYFLF